MSTKKVEAVILERIYNSVLKFLMPLSPEETYEMIVKEGISLCNASYGSLVLEEDGEFKQLYSNLPVKLNRRKKGSTYKAFKDSHTHVVYKDQFLKKYPQFLDLGLEAIIFIPLSYKEKAIGVLIINSKKSVKFTRKDLGAIDLFGSLTSLAVRKTQLYDETKKALEARDMFISMAAHELRTPLTTISGYSQLLHSRLANKGTTESRWAEQLTSECVRLTSLVNELLEVNRIKSKQLYYKWKEHDLGEILERAINNFKFNHPDYLITLSDKFKDDKKIVVGDFDKLLQLFDNTLDNAAKFSPSTLPIEVSLSSTSKHLIVSISDNGKGIENVDLPKVYERFFIGSNHRVEGMGLGLFIAKNIVDMHRAVINIKTKIGKGTKVEIKLPRTKV